MVIATARGALSLPDVTGYFARLVSSATLPYRKIFDGREAWLDLAERHVGSLATSVRAMASRGPRGPVAIVATTPSGTAGAHIFMRIPAADRPARLFTTLDAARTWLGPQDAALTDGPRSSASIILATVPDPPNGPARSGDAMSPNAPPTITADVARRQAGKARRLAFDMLSLADRDRLLGYAREMEERAAALEAAAPTAVELQRPR